MLEGRKAILVFQQENHSLDEFRIQADSLGTIELPLQLSANSKSREENVELRDCFIKACERLLGLICRVFYCSISIQGFKYWHLVLHPSVFNSRHPKVYCSSSAVEERVWDGMGLVVTWSNHIRAVGWLSPILLG